MTANREPFESIYRQFLLPVTKFVFKKMGSGQEADEVIAETFSAAWKGYHSFKHKSSYFTWLCRISLNKMADYYRDQINKNSKIVVPLFGEAAKMDDKSLSPEEKMALTELKKSVNDCLDLLPPEKRRLLQFRFWHDMTYAQIAKVLGVSERAVEGKLYRAKHSFAKVWTNLT